MNKFITYDGTPFVYLSEEGSVEKAFEVKNLKINDLLKGYKKTILWDDCYYTVSYLDGTLFIEWDSVYEAPNRFAIEDSTLLMQEAVKQLEEILSWCEYSMEEYIIDRMQPVQE